MIQPQAKLFSRCADAYRKYRPTYPPPVIETIFGEFGLKPGDLVCDLGAGTGILSSLLAEQGATVIAVDPLAEMSRIGAEQAAVRNHPVQFCQAVAEKIPLVNQSVQAVTCGQAFHWFDAESAFGEIHRVLTDGGGLALVWNFRDWENVPWLSELECLIMKYNPAYQPQFQMEDWEKLIGQSGLFHPVRRFEFFHERRLGRRSLLALVRTFSYVRILPDDLRAELEEEIITLFEKELTNGRQRSLLLRHRTDLYLTRKQI
jgi:SAM-dependent methyltransferase